MRRSASPGTGSPTASLGSPRARCFDTRSAALSFRRRSRINRPVPVDPFQFFLGLGLLMIALELIIPGLVVVFLGGAALVVAAALYAGIVAGWMPAFTLWFIASLVMVLGVRSAFTRFLPGSSVRQLTDEDLAAFRRRGRRRRNGDYKTRRTYSIPRFDMGGTDGARRIARRPAGETGRSGEPRLDRRASRRLGGAQ